MATASPQSPNLDRYVAIYGATTCDEHGVYVTKNGAEVIELGWILLDAKYCAKTRRESVLVKPVNTPITALCTSLTTLTWDQVRTAGTFRAAIDRFNSFTQEHLLPKKFAFVASGTLKPLFLKHIPSGAKTHSFDTMNISVLDQSQFEALVEEIIFAC